MKHVAIHVPDLAEAEGFYTAILRMEVVTRESAGDDGVWRQAPAELGWEELREAGRDIHMVALRRDDLVIALFPGQPRPGTIYLVGIVADAEEIAEARESLPDGTVIETDEPDALTFLDPFGFRWQLSGPAFLGAGDARGDWLDLQDRGEWLRRDASRTAARPSHREARSVGHWPRDHRKYTKTRPWFFGSLLMRW